MKEAAFHRIFDRAGLTPSAPRQEWQNRLALRKPGKGDEGKFGGRTGEAATRTQVLVILTEQPVFASMRDCYGLTPCRRPKRCISPG